MPGEISHGSWHKGWPTGAVRWNTLGIQGEFVSKKTFRSNSSDIQGEFVSKKRDGRPGHSDGIQWAFRGHSYPKKGIQIKWDFRRPTFTEELDMENAPEFPFYKIRRVNMAFGGAAVHRKHPFPTGCGCCREGPRQAGANLKRKMRSDLEF